MYLNAICLSSFSTWAVCLLIELQDFFLWPRYKSFAVGGMFCKYCSPRSWLAFHLHDSRHGNFTLSSFTLRTPHSLPPISLPTACLDMATAEPLVHHLCFPGWTFSQSFTAVMPLLFDPFSALCPSGSTEARPDWVLR